MALNNNGSVDAYEIFRDLDWLPFRAGLNETRDDSESARTGTTRGNTVELQQLGIPLTPQSPSMPSVSPQSSRPRGPEGIDGSGEPPDSSNDATSAMQDPRDRSMITLSGVLGAGLYVRSGSILRFGGPGAVLISFTVMGLLAWTVMQCIGEMLTLWPIPGALVEYVGAFVDEDLGIAVGIAYWFTYSIIFAALIVAGAGVLDFWDPGKSIEGTVMFFLVPLCIIFFNSFGVQIYGLSEVIGGSLKIIGICVVIGSMIAINAGAGKEGHIGTDYFKYDTIFPHDPAIGSSWASALFIAFSIAAFAYIGVDITAAIALEARLDSKSPQGKKSIWPTLSVRFVATWTTFIIWVIYFFAGIMLSFNVQWQDPDLPRESFLGSPATRTNNNQIKSNSGFVISASHSEIPGLDTLVAVIILVTVIFSANTNLYVASRSLFVLTRKIHSDDKWYLQAMAFFGKTNRYYVPVRAMLLSCCFLWVPFLYLSPHNSPNTTITSLLEILSQMGSVSCIIVWACECWAFVRFYNCLYKHRDKINSSPSLARLRRFPQAAEDFYPWRSHGQPITMNLALFGCLFVLIIADGAALWHGFLVNDFLSAYLAPPCFVVLWFGIKYLRWRSLKLHLKDLSDFEEAKLSFRYLNEIGERASMRVQPQQPRGWGNLWGLM
ncbi:hypothetical protein N7462_009940 [Penicillium macrosclerotiorum]|uniref:uncharacterized protein n=1 Tax=Penicillium macrosclerotiorum TaxID=303699 RepID=UPI002547C175|nr:uncharacterized protein N7462_009940 [Penicillium macrosclerotiorum]KAJ5668870.1 hypothetical protein N7462_009940 [Penicillium macrosclerotiorum]